MAFRKRLKSYGYTNVSIDNAWIPEGFYWVQAREPLGGTIIRVKLSVLQMHDMFR